MKTHFHCPVRTFEAVRRHVLQNTDEQAAFLFFEYELTNSLLRCEVRDYCLVQQHELEGDNSYHIDIKDETLSLVIQKAAKQNLALCEIHSHPFVGKNVQFSPSDRSGFEEFVPHVWWRLDHRPYVAIVFGQNDFDSLVWHSDPHTPSQLEALVTDNKTWRPTNRTFKLIKGSRNDRHKVFKT